jgi:hypothetical protein
VTTTPQRSRPLPPKSIHCEYVTIACYAMYYLRQEVPGCRAAVRNICLLGTLQPPNYSMASRSTHMHPHRKTTTQSHDDMHKNRLQFVRSYSNKVRRVKAGDIDVLEIVGPGALTFALMKTSDNNFRRSYAF